MDFYVGLHQPSDAWRFERCMISLNRLRERRSDFRVHRWVLDSGAFTEVSQHGQHRTSVERYAEHIVRWARCGSLAAAVAQDWMCEPEILARTGLSVAEHQRRTCDNYARLRALVPPEIHVMPVLQGYHPAEYAAHVQQYGAALTADCWVGVGSVCKRNAKPWAVAAVLRAIKTCRPDLQLHGFGLKVTALGEATVRGLLASADSMAWSFAGRQHRDGNNPHRAERFVRRVDTMAVQGQLWEPGDA